MIKITKQEFDRTAPHYCNCPDKETIEWKEYFKYRGIPKYKSGHFTKNKIKVECYVCQKLLKIKPSHIKKSKHIFCSYKCAGIWKSKNVIGENNPFYGKYHTEETKKRYKDMQIGKKTRPRTIEEKNKISIANTGKIKSYEHRKKLSESHKGKWKGEKNPKFNNWSSKLPYCKHWNEDIREKIRDHFKRKCFLCGKDESINFRGNKLIKLSVHHIDNDKNQGCNGKEWYLIPLCQRCHARKDTDIRYMVQLYTIRSFWKWIDSNI